MNNTTSLLFTKSPMRDWASLTDRLRVRHRDLELQCVKLTPDASAERRIDGLMLLDAAKTGERPADHARGIMIAVAGQVAYCHLRIRYGRFDQPLDFCCRHCHYRFVASMIWRRASISLFRSASRTWSSSQSTPAAMRSPITLRTTSCSPASSKSDRTTSLA